MKVLAIGDVIGKPGRDALRRLLPELKRQYAPDLVIVNGENAAGGIGLTPETADDLFAAGADVLTSGNHIWAHRDMLPCLETGMPVLRPLNYPAGVPGRGYLTMGGVLVVNLMGRTFMSAIDCPFRAMDALLASLSPRPVFIVVDFHAEATSEKMAMGHYLDGRVSAVLGTHTHVATTDSRILAGGTAYVTDIGMTGPINSVIGDDAGAVIQRFLTGIPHRLGVASGPVMMSAVLVTLDDASGRATGIERLYREVA